MSAVELWKAQQPLLYEWSSVDCSKWRIVGNGKNTASHRRPKLRIKISSTVLNRISASSPRTIHRSSQRNFGEPIRLTNSVDTQLAKYCEEQSSQASRTAMCVRTKRNVGKSRSYCKVSIKRVIVRFKSLSDRRISSILLIEWSTVV